MSTLAGLIEVFKADVNKARFDNTKTALKYAARSLGFENTYEMPVVYLRNAISSLDDYFHEHGLEKKLSKYRNNKNYLSYFLRWAEEKGFVNTAVSVLPEWKALYTSLGSLKKYNASAFKKFTRWATEHCILPKKLTNDDIFRYGMLLRIESPIYGTRKLGHLKHALSALGWAGVFPMIDIACLLSRPTSRTLYGIRYENWPDKLKKEYKFYEGWVAVPVKLGRPKRHKQRETTYINNRARLEQYIGYLVNIKGQELSSFTFRSIFSCENLEGFFNWLHDRLGGITETHKHMLNLFRVVILKYLKIEGQLRDFLECLDFQVDKKRDKNLKWKTLTELMTVAEKMTEDIRKAKSPLLKAIRTRDKLIFELLVRRALRLRNIVEGELGRNFYKTNSGEWRIYFSGREVKASDLDVAFPPDLVPLLEEYIEMHRDNILSRNKHSGGNTLFINSGKKGHLTTRMIYGMVSSYTLKYLGRAVNPHLFRTILATDIIENAPGNMDSKLLCVSKFLAHKNFNTTYKYYVMANTKKSVANVDKYLYAISHGEQSEVELNSILEENNSSPAKGALCNNSTMDAAAL